VGRTACPTDAQSEVSQSGDTVEARCFSTPSFMSQVPLFDIQTRHVHVRNGDLAIAAYLAEPLEAEPLETRPLGVKPLESRTSEVGTFPSVIVIQEIFGVNSHIREVTERFARAGYVAIAPAIYQRLAPGFEADYTADAIKLGRQYKELTKREELLGDIQAAIDYLKTLPNVKPGRVGCIGFCFGGHVAYLAATLPDIAATASFYGAGITTMCPGGGAPTVNFTSHIKGTLYAFFGMNDTSIPTEQVDAIATALQTHQIPHQIFRYANADHGFFCDQRASYNAAAAQDAWVQVQALFQQTSEVFKTSEV